MVDGVVCGRGIGRYRLVAVAQAEGCGNRCIPASSAPAERQGSRESQVENAGNRLSGSSNERRRYATRDAALSRHLFDTGARNSLLSNPCPQLVSVAGAALSRDPHLPDDGASGLCCRLRIRLAGAAVQGNRGE